MRMERRNPELGGVGFTRHR